VDKVMTNKVKCNFNELVAAPVPYHPNHPPSKKGK
jgi:hypothetical protein